MRISPLKELEPLSQETSVRQQHNAASREHRIMNVSSEDGCQNVSLEAPISKQGWPRGTRLLAAKMDIKSLFPHLLDQQLHVFQRQGQLLGRIDEILI